MAQDQWRDAFADLVARKTAAAAKAELPAYVTGCQAPPPEMAGIGNRWSETLFDGLFYQSALPAAPRPACSLVFVQSADGNTVTDHPASLGGGRTDTHLIYEGLSRAGCDAVLAGAQTVRGSHIVFSVWHPEMIALRATLDLPRHPVQLVASFRGLDLGDALLFNVPDLRVVLLTSADAAARIESAVRARPWITVVVMKAHGDLPAAFEQLRDRGIRRISCVGGRTLAHALLDAGLVDDVYLTTGTRPGGQPDTPLDIGRLRDHVILRKHGSGAEHGVVFEHFAGGTMTARS